MPMLPTDPKARKEHPIARGVLDYFPDAIAAVSNVSFVGNQQHNPGQPLHWSREKSNDHEDCIARHLIERGTIDTDGLRHSAKLAWRALALLQLEIEAVAKDEAEYAVYCMGGTVSDGHATPPPQPAPKFKVGDRVRICSTKPADAHADSGPGWADRMDSLLGAVGIVQKASYMGWVYVWEAGNPNPNATWAYRPTWLTLEPEDVVRPKRYYVAGPMRGLPKYNFPAFDEARDLGKSKGYDIISPADIDREMWGFDPLASDENMAKATALANAWTKADLAKVIERDVQSILSSDGIALLPGWERSTGARAELMVAIWAGIEIVDARTFCTFSSPDVADTTLNPLNYEIRRYLRAGGRK